MNCMLVKENADGSLTMFYKGERWTLKKGVRFIMGMDSSTGKIRSISSAADLEEKEVLFVVGEEVELRGCKFDVVAVYPDPANEITLKGKAQK